MVIYQFATQEDLYDQHYVGLGFHAPVAGGTARLGGKYIIRKAKGTNKVIEKSSNEKKGDVWTIGAGYEYPLSKRTAVKAYAGYADSGKAWKEVEDVAYNGYQVYLGLRHAF